MSAAAAAATASDAAKPVNEGSFFNFGGPGWFNDVFDCQIELDSQRKVTLKGFLFEQNVPLFRSDEKITGKLVIRAPPGWAVAHNGVRVELESSMQFYDSLNSITVTPDSETAGIEAARDGVVQGTTEIPFELNLANCKGKDGKPMVESYDGEKFDVRHSLLVTIKRPWYTFPVTRVMGIAIQNVSPAPTSDDLARVVPAQLGVVSRVPSIVVDDCGGTATLSYGRGHWNIGDVLQGTLVFSALEKPIVNAKLVLYKIEVADGDTQEKNVKEHLIFGVPPAAKEGEEPPVTPSRTEPCVGGETLQIAFPLTADPHGPSLSPTYDELSDPEATVNVHYYLRLLLEDKDGAKTWNTHEVIMYRSKLTGVSAVDV